MNLYYCIKCLKPLEEHAQSKLKNDFSEIIHCYNNANAVNLKSTYDLKWIIVFQDIECNCGEKYMAVWYSRFYEDRTKIKDYRLVHLNGSHFYPLLGLWKRKDCRKILTNLFFRWRVLASHIFWVTPFIGLKYFKTNTIQLDWNWLIEHFEPFKTTIITRASTKRKLQKYIETTLDIDYLAENFGDILINPFLAKLNIETYQKFHAKFYAAVFPQLNKAEVIETSYNIQKAGKEYYENISLREYPLNIFLERFLKPLKIENIKIVPESVLEQTNNGRKLFPVEVCIIIKEDDHYISKMDSCVESKWEFLNNYLPEIKPFTFSVWK
ncbi:MAG: hypothetical protein ACTSRG_17450 [Candidatus Helarchaeota archaeon]